MYYIGIFVFKQNAGSNSLIYSCTILYHFI